MRLRQATEDDDAFCFRLHEASMREYVEPIYGWDAETQRRLHMPYFDPDRLSIIEDDDGTPLACWTSSIGGDHLYLSRIEILPDAQGRGVCTTVVADLLKSGRIVRLHLFAHTVRARRFYERLGFSVDHVAEREGRLSMHHPGAIPGMA